MIFFIIEQEDRKRVFQQNGKNSLIKNIKLFNMIISRVFLLFILEDLLKKLQSLERKYSKSISAYPHCSLIRIISFTLVILHEICITQTLLLF